SRPRLAALSESLVRPVITWTRSPFLIFIFAMSHHLRCQRDDLHEALVTQLAAHGAEDAGAARLAVGLEDDRCVLVEADVGAVDATDFLGRADDDRLDDVALLDVATGDGVLDGRHDGVADAGVTATGATENTDAENLLGTRVVGDLQSRLLLNHSFSYRLTGSLPARGSGPAEPGGTEYGPCPVSSLVRDSPRGVTVDRRRAPKKSSAGLRHWHGER